MKKTYLLFFTALTLVFFITNCGDDDSMVTLPSSVSDYVSTNFPNYSIDEAEEDNLCDGTAVYEVEIEDANDNELELTFDKEGNFLFIETGINKSDLPSDVVSSINSNYPNYSIDEAERLDMFDNSTRYKVEIENNNSELAVLMEADGTVICEEEDD